MKLKNSLVNGDVVLSSSYILHNLFDGYIKPERILNKQEDIEALYIMIDTINGLVGKLEGYIGEM